MGKNIKALADKYKVQRDLKYITIDSAHKILRIRIPSLPCVTYNLKTFDGGLKKMLVHAIAQRDSMLKELRVSSILELYSEPIKALNLKYNIKQSSSNLYSDTLDIDKVDSIYVRGMIDGGLITYKVSLKDFKGLENSPYYHAHYYAVFIRNNAFRQDRPPTVKIEKAAFKWAKDIKNHKYQKMTESQLTHAINKFKETE